ncbi:MFS transporter [Aureimonas mangrovi]|uniref:MFS transporter n=1 Tax=Aureimonas mangrovi TaxID=2758041 RepID=UPI00163D6B8F|nr:MFS transporter [Aureimonas mangrovi]
MSGRLNLVAAGFALTAVTYGLARFAYGLLLPDIREDLALGTVSAGWIGGSSFAAYCVGIIFAFMAKGSLGERRIALLAGVTATIGLTLVVFAQSALALGPAIALAGLSTGLTSPPLAAAVSRSIEDHARAKANGAINAGTAAGIVFSGMAVLAFAGSWRELYALFAAIAAGVSLWLWFAVPSAESYEARPASASLAEFRRPGVFALSASAALVGVASTSIWTFGANLLREEFGFADGALALAWIVLGAAGVLGIATGALTDRFGVGAVHRLAVLAMALAIMAMAAASVVPALAFAAMGLFGLAYILSTGAFLLWGIELYPDRPELGLGLPFLVLALGQTAGAPLFGAVWGAAGSAVVLPLFAAIMASGAANAPSPERRQARAAAP